MESNDLRSEKGSVTSSDLLPSGLPLPKNPVESIFIGLLGLFMLIVPMVSILSRVGTRLADFGQSPWVIKVGQMILWILPKNLSWTAVYTEHATLWIGFLGAIVATIHGKHLGLATSHFMKPGRLRNFVEMYCHLAFIIVAWFLCYASLRFSESGRLGDVGDGTSEVIIDMLPGGVPKWMSLMIIPITFAAMAIRIAFRMTPPVHLISSAQHSILKSWLRWIFRLLVIVITIGFVYVGVKIDHLPWLVSWMDQLESIRPWIEKAGLVFVGIAFFFGTPIFISIAGLTMVLFFGKGTPIATLPAETFRLIIHENLPAIPLLTIAGYILASGKSAQRLIRVYKSLFGWMPGGIAVMAVFVCAIFTTFTGASGVTILALGGLIFPALIKEKYPQGFSLGVVTAAGSLGLLFPPSLPVLLYSVSASTPGSLVPVAIEDIYIGGFLPGVLMIVLVAMYAMFQGIRSKSPRQFFNVREMLSAIWEAKWDLLLPVVVVLPYSLGVARITEIAALGAVYALIVGLFIKRDVRPVQDFPFVLVQAATLVGTVIVLMGIAMGFTNYLVEIDLPNQIIEWIKGHIESRWLFLLVLNVVLLVLGSVLEIYSAILILVPLIAPLALVYHIDPVHLSVIFLCNLELGFLLPPVGLNLLLASNRFRKPLTDIYKHALPFLLIMTIGVLIVTYVEGATTWLLHLLKRDVP